MALMWFFGSTPSVVEDDEVAPPTPIYGPPCAVCSHAHEETRADPTDKKHLVTYVLRCDECGCVANGRAYAGAVA